MRVIASVLVVTCLGAFSGCASEYTVLDRSSIQVSTAAHTAAGGLLPNSARHPKIEQHLALATEVYSQQLNLLKERRNKVRARRRALTLTSYATMLVAGLATGYVALAATNKNDAKGDLKAVGVTALGGVGLGTGLQIGALMQEEPAVIDDKIRGLETMYQTMLDKVHGLAIQSSSDDVDAQMASAIEHFIDQALQINVKG